MKLKPIILANLHDLEMVMALVRAWWRLTPQQIARCRSTELALALGAADDITQAYVSAFGLGYIEHGSPINLMYRIARSQIRAIDR